ncbi:baseplate assembly protein [Rhizobium straminoryzae]|uniref:Baseplate assembly protein n=2 Tax=Rhizobium straminoryzae TaxID=1387186 RepID=A0A549T0V4_9HYPH|nr:baseplate assembly protein [Rhizobium straminoryzae]
MDVEALRNAFGRMITVGPVEHVDAAKGYRLKLGENPDGSPYLSPWLPHPETGKTSIPLEKGQIVGVINPGGDPRQGLLIRGGYSEDHASPNDNMAANVFAAAGVRISVVDGVLHIRADSHVVVEAPSVSLGGEGGKPVARIGDLVEVRSGSSAGRWPIVEGSSVVKAVD